MVKYLGVKPRCIRLGSWWSASRQEHYLGSQEVLATFVPVQVIMNWFGQVIQTGKLESMLSIQGRRNSRFSTSFIFMTQVSTLRSLTRKLKSWHQVRRIVSSRTWRMWFSTVKQLLLGWRLLIRRILIQSEILDPFQSRNSFFWTAEKNHFNFRIQ